jgi:hypothetical protein
MIPYIFVERSKNGSAIALLKPAAFATPHVWEGMIMNDVIGRMFVFGKDAFVIRNAGNIVPPKRLATHFVTAKAAE